MPVVLIVLGAALIVLTFGLAFTIFGLISAFFGWSALPAERSSSARARSA